jgi:hypothetical protein
MKIYKSLIVALFVFFTSSCEDKIEDINVNPDTFPTANDAQVLTSAQGFLGYIVDVDLNMFSFLWAQYYTWGIGVSIGNQERFVAEPDDFDGYWERSYSDALVDLKFLTKSESPSYRGVAKILQAYIYQGLVDHFGNIPFSEAVSGEIEDGAILTPAYDDAATVYAGLVTLLDEALADLDVAPDGEIGADDLVYGGDLEAWVKFANSLKLRILMRTSEVSPQGSAIQALISSGSFIESEGDMAALPFSGETGSQNPMFARAEWGVGDFYFASNATLNLLEDLGDPRGTAFYSVATTGSSAGQLRGIDQGTIDNEPFTAPASDYSGSSPLAYAQDNSVVLMSPWEVWFLRAEAAARYGTADDETVAFANGIQANFDYLGVAGGPAYIASLGYSAGDNIEDKIDMIATQKFISLNGTQEDEGWIETRRFDRPSSRLFTSGIFQSPPLSVLPAGTYPASWLYPSTERSLNPNAPAQRVITEKLFWDN